MPNKYKKKGSVLMAVVSLIFAVFLFLFSVKPVFVFADESDILYITASGDLALGVNLSNILFPQAYQQSATWFYDESRDYITFFDSTTNPGFRLNFYMSSTAGGDFVYSGSSVAQSDIDLSNFKIWGQYYVLFNEYGKPGSGIDDPEATLNIISSETCYDGQQYQNYSFNEMLSSETHNYGMTMSSTSQTYLRSVVDCRSKGTVDIRAMKLFYPDGSNSGTYSSQFVITVVDGY